MSPLDSHRILVNSLMNIDLWPHPVNSVQIIETHISTILLCGDYAYKIKKPVNFGFLDYSRLSSRKHFCEEEVRLNRRLAPSIYLGTTRITGTNENPRIDGDGESIEYAVKMRHFDDAGQLDRLHEVGRLEINMIEKLADRIAEFHQRIQVADADASFGAADKVLRPMRQNFTQIRNIFDSEEQRSQLDRLEQWTLIQYEELQQLIEKRRRNGFIRECHGDMHLGNIAWADGEILIFDGIEFNDDLRWIDVFSEIAFITMDLLEKGETRLSNLLLNRYLEKSGDYAGLRVLRFYQVYRAMVRAKVAALGMNQCANGHEKDQHQQVFHDYVDLAEQFTRQTRPQLLLMAGYSATGKSTLSHELLQQMGCIRIRSDRERKRLFGQGEGASQAVNNGIYQPEYTQKTYHQLLELCHEILQAGFSVIVDATFLRAKQRNPFQQLALTLSCDYRVLWLDASKKTLLQRLEQRSQQQGNISDANAAVIHRQLTQAEMPSKSEPSVLIDTEKKVEIDELIDTLMNSGKH